MEGITMTTLNGIHDAQYLAQFLGKKIAVRDAHNPNKYAIYPTLYGIFSSGRVLVRDSQNHNRLFNWDRCESPYVILQNKEIEIK
jgi:hypothetical protein